MRKVSTEKLSNLAEITQLLSTIGVWTQAAGSKANLPTVQLRGISEEWLHVLNYADSIAFASGTECILPAHLCSSSLPLLASSGLEQTLSRFSPSAPLSTPLSPLSHRALSQPWKWLSKMVAAACRRKLPMELCPEFKSLSSKSCLRPLPQKRRQSRKEGAINTVSGNFYFETFAC